MSRKKRKKKWKTEIVVALIGLSGALLAPIVTSFLSLDKEDVPLENGNVFINNGNIYNSVENYNENSYEINLQQSITNRPYTVRETYTSARSGEENIEYKLVSTDTRMVGTYFITYYTYDVTYY